MDSDTQTAWAKRQPIRLRFAFVAVGVGASAAYGFLVWRAWCLIQQGSGLANFRTAWLVEDNAVGFLVFSTMLGIALVVAVGLRWHQHRRARREWKELERQTGGS